MTDKRKFPVGNATPKQRYVSIPVDQDGRPDRDSAQWKTMIANAAARAPDDRSPAERSALRREAEGWTQP